MPKRACCGRNRSEKAVAEAAAHLATLTDPEARKAAMGRLADLQMRQAMAEEAGGLPQRMTCSARAVCGDMRA